MKKIILLCLLVFLFTLPSFATFTVVQNVMSTACGITNQSCAITVASTGSGNTIVVSANGIIANDFITAVSGGGTYTIPVACQATDAAPKSSSIAYTTASTSGTTSITITKTTTTSGAWRVTATELSSTGTITFDTCNGRDQNTSTTSMAGATLTLSGSNDAIVQAASGGVISAVAPACYSSNFTTGSTFAEAVCINTNSGTAPTWTQGSGRGALTGIAFQDAGGGATPNVIPYIANIKPCQYDDGDYYVLASCGEIARYYKEVPTKLKTTWCPELQALEPRKERMGVRPS